MFKKRIVILSIGLVILLLIILFMLNLFLWHRSWLFLFVLILLALIGVLSINLLWGSWLYQEGRFLWRGSATQVQQHVMQQARGVPYIVIILGIFFMLASWKDRYLIHDLNSLFLPFWIGVLFVVSGIIRLLNKRCYEKRMLKMDPRKTKISMQITFVFFVVYLVYGYVRYSLWPGFSLVETILVIVVLCIIGWLVYKYQVANS